MLRDCLLLILSVHCCFGDQSFSIVVDTTNSMREEIEIFKNNLEPIMQAMTSKHFDNFILIPFLHLDPGPPLVSQSPQGLVDLIDAIEVSERFGCRENSLSAIQKALEVSNPRSLIFVFTDAEAQDSDKMDSIQNLCVKQQSQVFVFQSGSCSQDSRLTENIYKKIVTSCGGSYSFFYLNDLQWAFQYMREIAKVDWTHVNTHKEFYGNKEYSFSVDVYTKAVVVAISGLKPQIEIKNNFGEKIRIDEIIVTSYMKVVRIPGTMFGEYTADISCQDAAMVTVYIKKELNFRYGFSPLQPNSFRETTLLPIPGIMNYLLISLPDHNLQLVSIHLKIFDENELRTFDHHVVDEKQRLYAATILIEPEKTFRILVKCRDYNNKEISGASKQMEPQRLVNEAQRLVPQAKILEIDPLIDFGRGYSLACKVISYPTPHIWWENSMQEKLDSESALLEIPQVYISYVKIESVTKNETITCKCKNSEGEDAIDAHIYVNRTVNFEVVQSPSDITVEYGSEGKLFCEPNTYPEAEIKWYLNDTLIENSENIEIIPEEHMLKISNMNLDTTGQYVCQISNSIETRTFPAEVYISGLETPQIGLIRSEILLKQGDQMELPCPIIKGKPYPEISWKYKSKYDDNQLSDVPEGVVTDGTALKTDSADLHHRGFYVCKAINVLGIDEKQISIQIQLPPKIKNEDEVRTVTLGDEVELPCDVEALPEANVHWDKYESDVAVPFDSRHSTDYSNTHRFKANNNDSGIYVCTAENSAGSAKRTVTITVLVAPYIEPLKWRSLAVRRGSPVILSCNVVSGNPVPYSRWVFIAPNLETTELIRGHSMGNLEVILKNITKKHEGSYQCITENEVGSDSVRASLTVL